MFSFPLSKGDAHSKENIQLVVEEVNRAKGKMREEEFIRLCRDVMDYKTKK